MKILWLVPYTIWPPIHGGKLRTYNLVSRLAARGHQVEVWCFTDGFEAGLDPALPNLSFRFWQQRTRASRMSKLSSLFSPLPTPAWLLRAPAVLAELRRGPRFDVVVLEQAHCGGLVPDVVRAGLPWVLDTQNVEWALMSKISHRLKNPVTKVRFAIDAMKFKRLERRLLQSARTSIAVSSEDAERMRMLAPSARIDMHPNGVDTVYFNFVNHTMANGANLLLTGTLGYYPNLDASLWLVNEIFPRVRSRLPRATLTLVGGGVPSELWSFDRPEAGVRVVGQVPDVRPYLAEADIFVMPIRIGGGTRLKALEALASGLPIVSTRLAVEGLGLIERDLVLACETSDEFAAAVERAITDNQLRVRLVEDGRRYVDECFDWDRIAEDFEATLERITN